MNLGPEAHRYLPVEIDSASLFLWAVYAPYADGCEDFLKPLQSALRADAGRATVLMGDLNAGLEGDTPATTRLAGTQYVRGLEALGYADLWRRVHPTADPEPSWHSSKNPFRIDHAFGSRAATERVVDVAYQHEGREQKLSDHSSLMLSLKDA